MDYYDFKERVHLAVFNYLVKKADVTPQIVNESGSIMVDRLQRNEDPTTVITDSLNWIIIESMQDSMSKGKTSQEAVNYMSGAHIEKWLIDFIKSNPVTRPNWQYYEGIVNSIDLKPLFEQTKVELFGTQAS